MNVACALQFIVLPDYTVGAYELSGVAGQVAVQGIGITFLMWNVTYPAFIASPRRFPVLGWVILAQQVIGLVGESALLFTLPPGHALLVESITRFVIFDAAGLVLMAAAFAFFKLKGGK
ncbi:MAG: hypothetical protein Q4E12_07820 [Coriobacteriia bacterium]|nr:hypothetical protein [Coriobacteriia bacterium]